jgi:diadenosine tetraphosphate (Ap4A) HIT family hydrolase
MGGERHNSAGNAACICCEVTTGVIVPPQGVHNIGSGWSINRALDENAQRPYFVMQTTAHRRDLDELAPGEAEALGRLLPRVTGHLKRLMGADRIHVIYLNDIDHVHLHLVACFRGDPDNIRGLELVGQAPPGRTITLEKLSSQLMVALQNDPPSTVL